MGYTVHGILQARILEWVAFSFSRESSQPRDRTQVSRTAGRFFTSRTTREAGNKVTACTVLSSSLQYIFVKSKLYVLDPSCLGNIKYFSIPSNFVKQIVLLFLLITGMVRTKILSLKQLRALSLSGVGKMSRAFNLVNIGPERVYTQNSGDLWIRNHTCTLTNFYPE